MIKVPGERPYVPQITPKEMKVDQPEAKPQQIQGQNIPNIGKGPEYDTAAIAQRAKAVSGMLAALAIEAEEKELSFIDIIDRIMRLTGITNPEAAMEEANRKLQKEIEDELQAIKSNDELMKDAKSWEEFAELLESQLDEDQVKNFINILKAEVQGKDIIES
jgi:hypothetical protein